MTPEQKALRERPEETIAEWDEWASTAWLPKMKGVNDERVMRDRLRAALGELKRLREEVAALQHEAGNIRLNELKMAGELKRLREEKK